MSTIFITGTDTGVGKTTVTSCLSAFLSLKKHLNVGVMKPFESGLSKRDKDLLPWDAICLREASGSNDDLDDISPYTFESPLAPEVAASLEHIQIDMDIVDRIYNKIKNRHDVVIIEGAGGVLVPIKKDYFYADLIKNWEAPAIIVSRLGLGTINHTLLTNNFLQSKGIKVLGVILNNNDGTGDLAAQTNPEILKRYLDVPLLGIFPYVEGLLKEGMDRELLATIFEGNIDTEKLII
ncbi:MAG TPA: dethiobiotin synthase [Syntrophorhabdaceae bacterium]|jgi:dethiobiotin synthetase|nr:dethiobiotin synthase [Syntrophorhabdaceae bacterium]MDI9559992.1 dethiobiotin synthase [Pseudomonadota bacterium]OQC47131.1 MAG: ATP-dependent dethiobiotin synthetase BioD 1 [Deltaproteobacteria bacterium ADurb.Bin026]MBP8699435.1 dethiobiotin synthase [Syntrophorhabdaceae bacterium]HNQ64249.1 dethiobiotin synthase [Syntrophorhabdaceae bacterium]